MGKIGKVYGIWRLGKLGKLANAKKSWDMRVMAVITVIMILAVLTIIAVLLIMAVLTIMRNMAIRQFWVFSQYECFLAREIRRHKKLRPITNTERAHCPPAEAEVGLCGLGNLPNPSLFDELRPEVASVFSWDVPHQFAGARRAKIKDRHFRVSFLPLKSAGAGVRTGLSEIGLAVGVSREVRSLEVFRGHGLSEDCIADECESCENHAPFDQSSEVAKTGERPYEFGLLHSVFAGVAFAVAASVTSLSDNGGSIAIGVQARGPARRLIFFLFNCIYPFTEFVVGAVLEHHVAEVVLVIGHCVLSSRRSRCHP